MTSISPQRAPRTPRLLAIGSALALIVAACSSPAVSTDSAGASPETSGTPTSAPSASPSPSATRLDDTALGHCADVRLLQERVHGLLAVELRLQNRVPLDIELGKIQSAFAALQRADLGTQEDQLEDPLRRLGYRLIDLEIAVEDFRTRRGRFRPAVVHAETDASAFDAALASFAILARC
jgi:hypothetical protein